MAWAVSLLVPRTTHEMNLKFLLIQAVLQHYIYITNPCGYYVGTCKETSTLNVWTQAGSYVLIAFSEIFALITGLEYAFTKAPKNMRSLVMGVFLFTSAISSALGEAFVRKSAFIHPVEALMNGVISTALTADPLLVWNYGSMGVLALIAGVLFWFTFQDLDASEDELNLIPEGGYEKPLHV